MNEDPAVPPLAATHATPTLGRPLAIGAGATLVLVMLWAGLASNLVWLLAIVAFLTAFILLANAGVKARSWRDLVVGIGGVGLVVGAFVAPAQASWLDVADYALPYGGPTFLLLATFGRTRLWVSLAGMAGWFGGMALDHWDLAPGLIIGGAVAALAVAVASGAEHAKQSRTV